MSQRAGLLLTCPALCLGWTEGHQRKLFHQKLSRLQTSVVAPPEQLAQEEPHERSYPAVSPFIVGDHGHGFVSAEHTMLRRKAVPTDHYLAARVHSDVAQPIRRRAEARDDDEFICGGVGSDDLEHGVIPTAGFAAEVRQTQGALAQKPAEV